MEDNEQRDEWSLYSDPSILKVRADPTHEGWIALTFEADPDGTYAIGSAGAPLNCQDFSTDGSPDLASLTLELKLEEIPRLIGILNDIYRRHHEIAVASLELGSDWEFPRRERLPDGRTLTWPIASRGEPETDAEDWKDRRALLCAFKELADRFADDLERLGALRPIG